MKIVDESEIPTKSGGKKVLNAPEKFLLEKENKKVRLSILKNMENTKAALVTLEDFVTNKKSVRNFDTMLNQVFILGEVPLIARKSGDYEIVIRKLGKFDLTEYNKGDKKEMSANHKELVQAKLAEVISKPPSWSTED